MMLSVESLMAVVYLIIIAWLTSATSWFLHYLYEWHPIGKRYKRMLRIANWKLRCNKWLQSIVKPLGLCVYCQSTWLAIITAFLLLPNFYWPFYVLHLGAVYIFVEQQRRFTL